MSDQIQLEVHAVRLKEQEEKLKEHAALIKGHDARLFEIEKYNALKIQILERIEGALVELVHTTKEQNHRINDLEKWKTKEIAVLSTIGAIITGLNFIISWLKH